MRFPSSFLIPAALALTLAGCGGTEEPAVATAASAGAPAVSAEVTADPITQYVEAQRAWVKCLRDAGIDAPDPDAKGRVAFDKADARTPAFEAAQTKCASLSTVVPDGIEEKPPLTAEDAQRHRDYATCIRQNGVPDFPDPDSAGEWTSSAGEDALRAQAICEPVLGGGKPNLDAAPKPANG